MSIALPSILAEHVFISLLPWLVGVLMGGGLGWVCALALRGLLSAFPGLRRAYVLLPWRTVVFALLLVLPPLIPILVGLGTVAGAAMVAFFVFLFALPFTVRTLLEHWHPVSLVVRLIAGARTFAAACVVVAAFTPLVAGSGGAGVLIFREGWQSLGYPQVLTGFCIVVLLALVIDLLLGALQLLFLGSAESVR